MEEQGSDTRVLSRRALLQKSAAGTAIVGAAWVAPAVTTLDRAVACGTCAQSSLTWANTAANNGLNPDDQVVDSLRFDMNGSEVQAGTAVAPNFVVQTQAGSGAQFGGQNSWYQLREDANAWNGTGQTTSRIRWRLTLRRSQPGTDPRINVNGFCFLIVDVDNQSGSGWRDRIRIVPTLADNSPALAPIVTPVAGSPPGPTGAGTNADPLLGVGTTNIPNESTNGNVLVRFPGPVNRIDLFYENGTPPEAPPPPPPDDWYSGSVQRIGITAFSWCNINVAGAAGARGAKDTSHFGEWEPQDGVPPTPMPGDGTRPAPPLD